MNHCFHTRGNHGFTITELVVVLGIIALLMGLLLPVMQSSRQTARETVCKNNLRQIGLGLEQLRNSQSELPIWEHETTTTGGWSVAVLPFVDPVYATKVYPDVALDSLPQDAYTRPLIFTCPMAPNNENQWGIPTSHYILKTIDHRRDWNVMDAPVDTTAPWLVGIERDVPIRTLGAGPHRRGFWRYWRKGLFDFVETQ